ncbi:endolytic transglycosylase MltG [Fannyhessea vaginae]|uniref:endolytic transglycosylase MltG n=1 Tax=Fannyhessea vaginae TaxID=82135 RepID=UPI00076FCA05|nr:endolytic transglycosylase MltG [Fannyhessea vaginae]KXG90324.1 YceG family protein [Fannyhessea vaginae]
MPLDSFGSSSKHFAKHAHPSSAENGTTPSAQKHNSQGGAHKTASVSATGFTPHVKRVRNHTKLKATHSPRGLSAKRPENRRVKPYVMAALAMVALLIVIATVMAYLNSRSQDNAQTASITAGEHIKVTIPSGANAARIAQLLVQERVISDGKAFLSAIQKQDVASKIKSGTYELVAGSDYQQLIDRLIQGPNSSENALVVPEGFTVDKLADLVSQQFGISRDDFLAQAKASNYVDEFPFLKDAQNDSLEGFLWPKTYDFSSTTPTSDAIIKLMLTQYKTETANLDFEGAQQNIKQQYGITMSRYDFIKLASIIEKEALIDEDRPLIASVMFNRLKADMPLQSDATMGYVTKGKVTPQDLKSDSPYNTQNKKGFPPTPICSPGIASLSAAMLPAITDNYYFWITKDEHKFSKTYDEHLQAIKEAKEK